MGIVRDEIYKCDICGNVVYVLEELEGSGGDLMCCGEKMRLLTREESIAFSHRLPKPLSKTGVKKHPVI